MAATDRLFAEFRSTFECKDLKVTVGTEPSVFVVPPTSGSATLTVSAGEPVSPVAAKLILTVVTRREVTGKPAKALQGLWTQSSPADESELPQYLQDLLAEVEASARESASRLIRLYQWRWGGRVRTGPDLRRLASEFSVRPDDWRPVPPEPVNLNEAPASGF
jgi:hypothetical protein